MVGVSGYVHGYATKEQERLVRQAEHWRGRLICDGTQLEPGTRLLEVGCGAGALLAVLGQEFPGVRLFGVDIEPKQLEFARAHLERSGVEATLVKADAMALPFEDGSFDHVWMMWFLEHVFDPPAALREARRVLVGTSDRNMPTRPFIPSFTLDGRKIIVPNFRANNVSIVDLDRALSGHPDAEVARIPLTRQDAMPARPKGSAVTADGRYAVISGGPRFPTAVPFKPSGYVYVIDLKTMKVVGTVTGVGNDPYGLAVVEVDDD